MNLNSSCIFHQNWSQATDNLRGKNTTDDRTKMNCKRMWFNDFDKSKKKREKKNVYTQHMESQHRTCAPSYDDSSNLSDSCRDTIESTEWKKVNIANDFWTILFAVKMNERNERIFLGWIFFEI